ncbi:MAG: radical SAM protein [Caldithrix sp.]|nr:radical SAM protein [Caldithrix sp.]
MINVNEFIKRSATLWSDRIHTMPIVTLMPHSACNCRCVMCDIWKANQNKQEISTDLLSQHLHALKQMNVKWAVLSGGEALMHSNMWKFCEMLKTIQVKISILSTGLLLKKHVESIVKWTDEVIVSLDGSAEVHNRIRNIPNAFQKLQEGIQAVRHIDPEFRISGRCVLQRLNYFDLSNIIDAARTIGLNQISFLAADVSSTAFNRPGKWDNERASDVALNTRETQEFSELIETTIDRYASWFEEGFIAESPDKLRKLAQHYAALNGRDTFPYQPCNAPWVSTVIEADGSVRPCFFHKVLGNINEQPLTEILNSKDAIRFRKQLDVRNNETCKKCVCRLHVKTVKPVVE